jgi:predicted nucleic acid-binding protein
MKAIADTGFLVAFANRNDRHHEWAVQLASSVAEPLLTCEAVLAEAAFHLSNVPLVMEMMEEGLVRLNFSAADHLPHIADLGRRYRDRNPDFADLCLIRMSELFPKYAVITVDREDFAVYRKNRREIIQLICPPEE